MVSYLKLDYKDIKDTFEKVALTKREIDTIACILNGKSSYKSIANMLAIHPKTAEKHKSGILQKLGDVHKFVETTNSTDTFRKHYDRLMKEFEFRKTLNSIGKELEKKKIILHLEVRSKNISSFLGNIEESLKLANIQLVDESKNGSRIILYRDSFVFGEIRVGFKDYYFFVLKMIRLVAKDPKVENMVLEFLTVNDHDKQSDRIYVARSSPRRVRNRKKNTNRNIIIAGFLYILSLALFFGFGYSLMKKGVSSIEGAGSHSAI